MILSRRSKRRNAGLTLIDLIVFIAACLTQRENQ